MRPPRTAAPRVVDKPSAPDQDTVVRARVEDSAAADLGETVDFLAKIALRGRCARRHAALRSPERNSQHSSAREAFPAHFRHQRKEDDPLPAIHPAPLLALFFLLAPLTFALPSGVAPATPDGTPGVGAVHYLVGLETVPRDMQPGDEWNGHRILKVNHQVHTIVIGVRDAQDAPSEDADVRFFHPDSAAFHASYVPNDLYYNCCQWGIRDIQIEDAFETTLGATSVTLAVLDTGLRKTHEDIGNHLQGRDFIDDDLDPQDCTGHGTHVTSTAAGRTDNGRGVAGVAQARILPVRVLDCGGSGTFSQIIDGITYAADQGADIVSMSLGATVGSPGLQDAVDYAWDSGALVVAAAGNGNGAPINYPARYSSVVAVTAYDQQHNLASFSNQGPEAELSAPGVQIAAAYHRDDTDYVYLDGTSMATPMVSGAAALALTVDPTLTNGALRQLLRDTARDFGTPGFDNSFGYGAIDANALVDAAASGGGGGGEETVYAEDFEGATQFGKSSGSTDWWRRSSGCLGGNEGTALQFNRADTNCVYGSGSSRVTGWARTTVDLSGATSATLAFDHKWTTEAYSGGAYDIQRVQVSNTGSSWTTLVQYDSRDPNQAAWKAESFDLSAWTGDSTVYVRFFFDTVDGVGNNHAGWSVDNFHVTKG